MILINGSKYVTKADVRETSVGLPERIKIFATKKYPFLNDLPFLV